MDNQQQTLFNEASFSVGLVKSMVDKWIPQDDKIIHNQQLLSHSFIQPKPALLYTSSLKSDKATKKLEAIKHQVELNRLKKLEIQETIMKHSQVEDAIKTDGKKVKRKNVLDEYLDRGKKNRKKNNKVQ